MSQKIVCTWRRALILNFPRIALDSGNTTEAKTKRWYFYEKN